MKAEELPGEVEELEKTLEKFQKKRDTAGSLMSSFKDNEELFEFYTEREKTYDDACQKITNRLNQLESEKSAKEE